MKKTSFAEAQTIKLSWPTPQDYNEALQHPGTNFSDPELKVGKVGLNKLGLPKSMTGNFASVYFMDCPDKDYAVRFFLHNIAYQKERYEQISKYLNDVALPVLVDSDYVENGIQVNGIWYPMLRMDWVEGQSLIEYIGRNLDNAQVLEQLRLWLRNCRLTLEQHGIAHGDLQHGNIIVTNKDIKLVDYDGMYVPELKGYLSNELGHRNYQHPGRSKNHFGPYLDNFAGWLVDTSILCLELDPRLWIDLNAGDDCLLFREADLKNPNASRAFYLLETHQNDVIRFRAKLLRWMLQLPIEDVPGLDPIPVVPADFPDLDKSRKPDWLSSADRLVMPEVPSRERRAPVSVPSAKEKIAIYDPQSGQWKTSAQRTSPPMQPSPINSGTSWNPFIVAIFCLVIINAIVLFATALTHSRSTPDSHPVSPVENVTQESQFAHPDDIFNVGIRYYQKKQYQNAIRYFDTAIRLNPKKAIYYRNRGAAYGYLGQHEKAILDFKSAIKLEPEHAGNFYNLGQEYVATSRYEAAAMMYRKTLELNPSHADARHNLEIVEARMKFPEQFPPNKNP